MIRKWFFQILLSMIANADDDEAARIVFAVIARYKKKFPDQEVYFLSMPLHDQSERKRTLDAFLAHVQQQS